MASFKLAHSKVILLYAPNNIPMSVHLVKDQNHRREEGALRYKAAIKKKSHLFPIVNFCFDIVGKQG